MSITRFTTGLEEYELYDARTVEYLKQILAIIVNTQKKIEVMLEELLDPHNCHKVVLLLRTESETNVEVAESVRKLQLYAAKYLRVTERTGKTYPAALAKYKAAVLELLNKAGLTNEQKLLKSFASRVERVIEKSNIKEKEEKEYV